MEKVLKNMVIGSVEDTYLKDLNNKYTGFLRVTCHDILVNLTNHYGNITTTELEEKNQWINEPIDLYLQIDK